MKEFIEKLIGRLEEEKETSFEKYRESFELYVEEFWRGRMGGFAKAIVIVNQLAEEYKEINIPTIDAGELLGKTETDGWIPCSDRLPRIGEQVMVCNRFGSVFVSHINYLNPRVDIHGRCHDFGSHYNVIAWQPLPEPYQPKGE